jgi:hypothetical protein
MPPEDRGTAVSAGARDRPELPNAVPGEAGEDQGVANPSHGPRRGPKGRVDAPRRSARSGTGRARTWTAARDLGLNVSAATIAEDRDLASGASRRRRRVRPSAGGTRASAGGALRRRVRRSTKFRGPRLAKRRGAQHPIIILLVVAAQRRHPGSTGQKDPLGPGSDGVVIIGTFAMWWTAGLRPLAVERFGEASEQQRASTRDGTRPVLSGGHRSTKPASRTKCVFRGGRRSSSPIDDGAGQVARRGRSARSGSPTASFMGTAREGACRAGGLRRGDRQPQERIGLARPRRLACEVV